MRSQRLITTSATMAALALPALAPALASAGSLLSGYGGPGQGNQAILGSALLGGPSGGGGSAGGGPLAASTPVPGAAESSGAGRARAKIGAARGAGASVAGAAGTRRNAPGSDASAGGSQTYTAASDSTVSGAGSGGSQPLGLSSADVLYMLLALATLGVTALLTRRLARQPG